MDRFSRMKFAPTFGDPLAKLSTSAMTYIWQSNASTSGNLASQVEDQPQQLPRHSLIMLMTHEAERYIVSD